MTDGKDTRRKALRAEIDEEIRKTEECVAERARLRRERLAAAEEECRLAEEEAKKAAAIRKEKREARIDEAKKCKEEEDRELREIALYRAERDDKEWNGPAFERAESQVIAKIFIEAFESQFDVEGGIDEDFRNDLLLAATQSLLSVSLFSKQIEDKYKINKPVMDDIIRELTKAIRKFIEAQEKKGDLEPKEQEERPKPEANTETAVEYASYYDIDSEE